MRRLAIILAALAIPVCARPQPAPPTALQVAAARAEADSILAKTGTGDLFENITDGEIPQLRHRASGMVCFFNADGVGNSIFVYPNGPRGDDVSCGRNIAGAAITQYATRAPRPVTATQLLASVLSEIRSVHGELVPDRGEWRNMSAPTAPEILRARFTYAKGDPQVFSRAAAAVAGQWLISQRLTAPRDKARDADFIAEATMLAATLKVAEDASK